MSISKFYKSVSYVLVFLMLFSPFAFTSIKMACFAILVLTALITIILYNSQIVIAKSVVLWLSLFIIHGLFFLALGVLHGADISNVLKFSTIAVLWPLAFSFLFFFKIDVGYIINLYQVMKVSVFFISIYTIYKVASLLGYLPVLDIFPEENSVGLMITDSNVELSLPAATTLMFAIPSLFSFYLLTKDKKVLLLLLLGLVCIILISRRALLLNAFITPFLCFAVSVFFLGKSEVKKLANHILIVALIAMISGVIIFTGLAQANLFDFKEFYSMILEGFDFSGKQSVDPGAEIRADQFNLLMKSWSEKPILGWGYGAVSEYIIRSDTTPFIYELSYIALLFQTGIVGTLIYMLLIGWLFVKLYHLRKLQTVEQNKLNIAVLVGLITFLLSNATNPYLYAFDHMWTLFYPLLIINTLVLKKQELPIKAFHG